MMVEVGSYILSCIMHTQPPATAQDCKCSVNVEVLREKCMSVADEAALVTNDHGLGK